MRIPPPPTGLNRNIGWAGNVHALVKSGFRKAQKGKTARGMKISRSRFESAGSRPRDLDHNPPRGLKRIPEALAAEKFEHYGRESREWKTYQTEWKS